MSWNISNQLAYIETQIADISGLTDPLTNPLDCGNQNLYNIDSVICNNDVTCRTLNYTSFNPPLPTSYRPTNNYYVAPNGNDISNNGSILAPFQTIGKAIQYAGLYAPDTPTEIFIYAGTYVENITTPLYNLSFTAYNGGSGGDNEALPNQSVVLQGNITVSGTVTTPINVPTTFNNIYFKNSQMVLNFFSASGSDFSVEFNNCALLINNTTGGNNGFIFTGNATNNYNVYFNNCDIRCTANNGLFLITTANFYMNNCQVTASLNNASFFNFVLPINDPNTIRFNNTTVINTSTAPNNYYMIYFGSGCFGSITNCNFIYKSTASAPEQSVISTGGGTFDNFYNNQFICPGCTTTDPSGNICMLQMAGPSSTMTLNNCYNNYGLPGRTGYGIYTPNITFNSLQQSPAPLNTITDISNGNTGIQVSASGTQRLISNLGVIDISGSVGVGIGGTKLKYQINNLGVIDISGSIGIQVTGNKNPYTINNLGVIDISSGNTGISISGAKTGRIITNTGVNDISGGTGISISGTKPATQTITNIGVIDISSGNAGIQITGNKNPYTISNTGVLDISGSVGIGIGGTKTKYQINNLGVLDISGSYGIQIAGNKSSYQIINSGITDISAGSGISITGSKPGPLTISSTLGNNIPQVFKFTTAGAFTWTVPSGFSTCFIYAIGGGGGGGGTLTGTGVGLPAGGGGGSGYIQTLFTPVYGGQTSFSGFIGGGGAGGTGTPTTATNGANGQATTLSINGYVGDIISAAGGGGGGLAGTLTQQGAGGAGAFGGGGASTVPANPGAPGGTGTIAPGVAGYGTNGGQGGWGGQITTYTGSGGGGGPMAIAITAGTPGPGAGGDGAGQGGGTGRNGQPGMIQFICYP